MTDKYIDSFIKEININTYIPNAEDWLTFVCNYEKQLDFLNVCKPLSQILNLNKGQLPDINKLNKKQIGRLIFEISKTLQKLHVFLEFPLKTPLELRYKLITDIWEEELYFYPHLNTHIDFCTGSCKTCELLMYCDVGKDINVIKEF